MQGKKGRNVRNVSGEGVGEMDLGGVGKGGGFFFFWF